MIEKTDGNIFKVRPNSFPVPILVRTDSDVSKVCDLFIGLLFCIPQEVSLGRPVPVPLGYIRYIFFCKYVIWLTICRWIEEVNHTSYMDNKALQVSVPCMRISFVRTVREK